MRIELHSPVSSAVLSIISIQGETLNDTAIYTGTRFGLEHLPAAIYLITHRAGEKTAIKKFIRM